MRSFKSLSEQEILALAISLEEEDARIYDDFAEGLKSNFPATAELLREMRAEEDGHRHRLPDFLITEDVAQLVEVDENRAAVIDRWPQDTDAVLLHRLLGVGIEEEPVPEPGPEVLAA